MTNEEIEAVNTELMDIARSLPLESARHRAYELIDDLCEAARESQSLVGRRVLVKANKDAQGYRITGERTVYCIGRFDGDEFIYAHTALAERDDFELLDGANV